MVGTAWNKASTDPVNLAFIAGQKARGNDPDQFCAQAYTGVLVIADAIAQAGMKGGRDDVKAGFLKVKDLPTPLGKFSFLPSRDGSHARRRPGREGRQVRDPAVAPGTAPRGAADRQRPVPGEHLRALRAGVHARLRRARHPQPGAPGRLHDLRLRGAGPRGPPPHAHVRRPPGGGARRGAARAWWWTGSPSGRCAARSDSNIAGLISSIALATILEAAVAPDLRPGRGALPLRHRPHAAACRSAGRWSPSCRSSSSPSRVAHAARPHLAAAAGRGWGGAIRAVAESPRAARVLGVDVDRIISASFFVSSALGGGGRRALRAGLQQRGPGHGALAWS